MNIAVVFEAELQSGGGYQQQLSTIVELQALGGHKIIAFVFSEKNRKTLEDNGIPCVVVPISFFDKLFRKVHRQEWFLPFSQRFQIKTSFERILDLHNIDLVYFLSPSALSLDLITHNYIITVWDLCHRDTPEFPEVNYFREFELREKLYTKSLKKAVAILVDSQLGKLNVIKRYGIDDRRVFIAPFAPSVNSFINHNIDIKSKYKLDGKYIYYPAQFWSHKNHVYIIDALAILKQEGIYLTALFSGSNKGNLDYVLEYAKRAKVEELVKYIGFAPNEEIYSLYKNALAMVMPSYFGPTNIPPLEAFEIGTPVIYSDLDGLKDQVGDAALLCDLKDPKNLADHLKVLFEEPNVREYFIKNGHNRLKELMQIETTKILHSIIDDYAVKLKCWKI